MDRLALVNMQLDGVRSSAQRARVAFFIAILSACAVTVTLYNEHFAWSRRLLEDARGFTRWPPSPAKTPAPSNIMRGSAEDLAAEKQMETIRNWEDNTYIKLDLLGIRLGAADLTFFGSLAMLIVSIYYCLCARRNWYDIGSLVVEVSNSKDIDLERYVLDGIRQSLVLTVTGETEHAVFDSHTPTSPRLMRLVVSVLSLLTYSPTVAIAAILYGDARFAFLRDDVPNWQWILQNLHHQYLFQFIGLDVFAIVLMVFVWYLNRLTSRFEHAAGKAIIRLAQPKDTQQKQTVAAAR